MGVKKKKEKERRKETMVKLVGDTLGSMKSVAYCKALVG